MVFLISRLETFIQIIITQTIRQTHGCNFSQALDKNFRLDTGRKLEQGLMMEYLHETAAHVVALKTKFYQEHYSNLSKYIEGAT